MRGRRLRVKLVLCLLVFVLGAAVAPRAETLPLVSFYDKHGAPVTLKDFEGAPLLVNLWATWCPPCVDEMAALARLQGDTGLRVVAISFDRRPVAEIESFLKKHAAGGLAVYHDKDRAVAGQWRYAGLPTSYLLDAKGNLLFRYEGWQDWDSKKTRQDIQARIKP